MANHKRGRPKNRRAGCLLCKPHKANGVNDPPLEVKASDEDFEQQAEEALNAAAPEERDG